jgi:hypothetical protein
MGQYYRGVVLGKTTKRTKKIIVRQAFCCYAHNNGAKLMEHSYVGNYYVKEYENSLATTFYGYPFVWVGDYADEKFDVDVYTEANDFINKVADKIAKYQGYKKIIDNHYDTKYINKDGERKSITEFYDKSQYDNLPTYEYIINFTKRLFIKIPKQDKNVYTVHPLPLLCADGNGRGGGDYVGTNMDLIGSWAYDRIGVSNVLPKGFNRELVATFVESYEGGDSSLNDYKIVNHKEN